MIDDTVARSLGSVTKLPVDRQTGLLPDALRNFVSRRYAGVGTGDAEGEIRALAVARAHVAKTTGEIGTIMQRRLVAWR